MLERLLRRLLWVVPSALGVLLFTFYATSLVPRARIAATSPHARYADLPLFFNPAPADVHVTVRRALAAAATGDEARETARAELVRIGGAALPIVIPELEALSPEERARVATMLAPIAYRMGLAHPEEAADPARAARFWARFWESSEVEFRRAAARNAARRWVVYGEPSRAEELHRLDTFALEALFELLPERGETFASDRAARTIDALAHATGRDDRISEAAGPEDFEACFARWRGFWIAERTHYVSLSGSDRIAAVLLETRLGKWALETLATRSSRLGRGDLANRFGCTARHLVPAWALASLLAVVLGTWSAGRHGVVTFALEWGAWGALAATSVTLAAACARVPPAAAELTAVAVLALGMLAARARGASEERIAWKEALPACLPAVVAVSWLDLPVAVTACFVVEHALGLAGLGELTLAAVQSAEVGALMALALSGTVIAGLSSTASDLVLAWLDPRPRRDLIAHGRRA